MEAGRTAATGDGEAHFDFPGEGFFEFLDDGTGSQKVSAQHGGNGGDIVIVDEVPSIGKKGAMRRLQAPLSAIMARKPSASSQSVLVSLE